jgi:hypothetical protein
MHGTLQNILYVRSIKELHVSFADLQKYMLHTSFNSLTFELEFLSWKGNFEKRKLTYYEWRKGLIGEIPC